MCFPVVSLVSLVVLDDMTSDYVRRSVVETEDLATTTGYRKLALLRDGRKPRTRSSDQRRESESCAYIYGNGGSSEDEIRNEDIIELAPRNRQKRMNENEDSVVTWVEVATRDGDTLTSVALRYNCKVAELKHLNKLMRDQDFYSLKKIRIPVVRHGVLEERILMECSENAHTESAKSMESNELWPVDGMNDSGDELRPNTQNHEAQRLLLKYDDEIQKSLTRLDPLSADAVVRPSINRQVSKSTSWRTVLTFFGVFCVVIPLLYVILKRFFIT